MPKPAYIDLRGTIPYNPNSPWIRHRLLTNISYKMVHYTADRLPANATQQQEVQRFIEDARFHQQKDWSRDGSGVHGWTIMYHYGIGPSGRIYVLNNETEILWNCTNANPVALATVLILGPAQQPTQAMLSTLQQHLDYLCTERPDLPGVVRQTVYGHGETARIYGGGPDFGNDTDCPGKALQFVRNYRNAVAHTPAPSTLFFQETGQTIVEPFLTYFMHNGQVPRLGLPITAVIQEQLDGASERLATRRQAFFSVQYFERARLEDHAAQGIMRGLIGVELRQLKNAPILPPTTPVAPRFAGYYNANGGVAELGFAISDEMQEELLPGKTYFVQYFQRARLEDHGAQGIMRGLVGAELLALRAGAAHQDH